MNSFAIVCAVAISLLSLSPAVFAQKMPAQKPMKKKAVDPVLAVLKRAQDELATGNVAAARKSYEEAFKLDRYHRHDDVNVALATLILDEKSGAGVKYDLTREQLVQRFQGVPYLAEGFCQVEFKDKEGARHAWHKIIEWRNSDELVQYLHEFQLHDEVTELKAEMGIDSGTGIGARKALEEKYRKESKWEGAFQLARKRLLEMPVGSGGESDVEFEKLTKTCVDYFFKQSNPNAGLKKLAEDLYQRTRDHERVLRQIVETKQSSKTSLARVRRTEEADALLRGRIVMLDETAAYLSTLAGHPEAPVAAEALAEEPLENQQQAE
jgi:hypothetical protein